MSAPGRLDFMGGVGDYSGGLVLQVATSVTTSVRSVVTPSPTPASGCVTLKSGTFGTVSLPLSWLSSRLGSGSIESGLVGFLKEVRAWLDGRTCCGGEGGEKLGKWVYYVFGSLAAFAYETAWVGVGGVCIELDISSRVPLGQGVSSSASIEVATIRSLCATLAAPGCTCEAASVPSLSTLPTPLRTAHLAQGAENYVVGAPCGLMDQLASSLGAPGCVLPILCRPDAVEAPVALPPGVVVVGWPSGVEHSLADKVSPYLVARTASFMAKKILEGLNVSGNGGSGTNSASASMGKVDHLSQLTPSQLASVLGEIPELLSGADFTRLYGKVDDPLSVIEPTLIYRVRAGALFPVAENFRCATALALLRGVEGEKEGSPLIASTLSLVGEMMRQTHRGYSSMGLGCEALDAMLEALGREIGVAGGVYGARISGGGSGGTMCILCSKAALPAIEALAQRMTFGKPFTGLIL